MSKKAHNDCRYFKNGWCTADEETCLYAKNPDECGGYEASGLGKNKTIERDRNRKEKTKRQMDLDDE